MDRYLISLYINLLFLGLSLCLPSERTRHDNEPLCQQENRFYCTDPIGCYPNTWKCDGEEDCKDGVDERNCGPLPQSCEGDQYRCSSSRCIPKLWACDGDKDCRDREDEENCPFSEKSCKDTEFRCNEKQLINSPVDPECIPKSWLCDGKDDCINGIDEKNCTLNKCEETRFRCSGGVCIELSRVCDGKPDCREGEDERNCTGNALSCKENEFQCHKNQTQNSPNMAKCIPKFWVCDEEMDCSNGSDEENCPANASIPQITTEITPNIVDSTIDPVKSCDELQLFQCSSQTDNNPNSSNCIPTVWVCDGDMDCSNGLDEKNCPSNDNTASTPQSSVITTEITSNSADTTIDTVISCDEGQFQCTDQTQNIFLNCIPEVWACDGVMDCLNGLDEENCPSNDNTASTPQSSVITTEISSNSADTTIDTVSCHEGQFQCTNQTQNIFLNCIPEVWACDGVMDCLNGLDEENCTSNESTTPQVPRLCQEDEFECDRIKTGHEISVDQCIPNVWLCDGDEDCSNGMDESNCTLDVPPTTTIPDSIDNEEIAITLEEQECLSPLYKCKASGFCILEDWFCDGFPDCSDGEDELDCPDSDSSTTPIPDSIDNGDITTTPNN